MLKVFAMEMETSMFPKTLENVHHSTRFIPESRININFSQCYQGRKSEPMQGIENSASDELYHCLTNEINCYLRIVLKKVKRVDACLQSRGEGGGLQHFL
jgi:hypothetical protein